MSRHTTFAIGGPADLFITAHTVPELCTFACLAHEHGVPYFVLGWGANLLVADKGIRGLVIHNECAAITIEPGADDQTWLATAESGAMLQALARETIARGLAGLEWAVDVPGTVGGAVVGNAGAFGGYVGDSLRRALICWPAENGSTSPSTGRWWTKNELKLDYRTSILKESRPRAAFPPVILQAEFDLSREDPALLEERAQQYTRRRLEMQPAGPSAGSVFKRTPQYPAGFLIENAGLKGTRVGGAEVSPQHANFIINLGGATAGDVRQLIELVRERVQAQFKIALELEVELVGDW